MGKDKESRRQAASVLRSKGSSDRQRSRAAKVLSISGATVGGKVRARKLSPARRSEIARMGGKAAAAKMKRRWEIIRKVEAAEEKARDETIEQAV